MRCMSVSYTHLDVYKRQYLNNDDYNDLIKIINPIVNEFNDGNLTKIPNVDWFYEYLNKLNEFSWYGYNLSLIHI